MSTSATAPADSFTAVLLRKLLPVALFFAAGLLLIVALGVAQRLGWLKAEAGGPARAAAAPGTIYTCPMHPQIRQPTPGRCPICGMELVPAASAAASIDLLAVRIEPAQRRLANIQTAPVQRGPLDATLQTVGTISIDESRQATISAYIGGRLERLFADYTGVEIAKGDHLAVLYSPQLYTAQVEYLEARRAAAAAAGALPAVRQAQETLAANTRQRLRELGVTEEQLGELEKSGQAQSRLTIYAPQGGTVIAKPAVEGDYVEAGQPIYRIAELSTVWLMLELFPADASRIRYGQPVEAAIQSLPGQKFPGRVAFLSPTVDPKTRTVGVRVELPNEERKLRPGDYAEARITLPIGPLGQVYDSALAGKWISPMHPQIIRDQPGRCPICGMELVPTSRFGFAEQPVPQPESLFVPRSAVLMAGESSVIYVETNPGRFEMRPVTVGPILRDQIVIVGGVKEGEQVATAGNFLIDSQMQISGKPSLIDVSRAIALSRQQGGPLKFENLAIRPVAGEAGQKLEELYAAYFAVQQALAADKPPPAAAGQSLHALASELAGNPSLPKAAQQLAKDVAAHAEHLHHLDLAGARQEFKPLSHAVVSLAAQARSAAAHGALTHFYCPMVPGGGGDWLQSGGELVNPYFGSQMLRCGEKVEEFPPPTTPATPPAKAPAEKAG